MVAAVVVNTTKMVDVVVVIIMAKINFTSNMPWEP
jgi:hypothetical protein